MGIRIIKVKNIWQGNENKVHVGNLIEGEDGALAFVYDKEKGYIYTFLDPVASLIRELVAERDALAEVARLKGEPVPGVVLNAEPPGYAMNQKEFVETVVSAVERIAKAVR